MKISMEKRASISFWINVVSFIGSIIFLARLMFVGEQQNHNCKDCIDKVLYYQHRADSLESVLENKR